VEVRARRFVHTNIRSELVCEVDEMTVIHLIGAACIGLFFGILIESFKDVSERVGHLVLGFTLFCALLTALFFLACTRFYGEAALACLALCCGSLVGWALSRNLNFRWCKRCKSEKSNSAHLPE
jgi:hypothetical protein